MRTLLEISKSGLKSAERALSVTSNNIINADTPGYSRQRLEQAAKGMRMSGYHAGLGVNITSLTRMRNEMNDVLMNQKQQDMSFLQGQARVFEQIEATMATDSGNDLDLTISQFLDSFSELSSNPQDMSVRNTLMSNAKQLTAKFHDMDRSLDRISELTRDSASRTISDVNELLKQISALNKSIAQAEGAGQPDNNSLDNRVAKLNELSKLIDFEPQFGDNGAVEIRIGGVSVLDGQTVQTIRPEIDDVNREFRLRINSGKSVEVKGGKLGAEMDMYINELPDIRDQLDKLAGSFVKEINQVHQTGYGLNDDTNRNFFTSDGVTAADISINPILLDDPANVAASSASDEAGNGEIATQIAELRNDRVVEGRKFVDFSINLISTPGSKLQNLQSQIEARDSELNMLKTQQEQEAGVNIDEELSLMIQYQNAYQGAAKVMSAAQSMYDTLIGIVR